MPDTLKIQSPIIKKPRHVTLTSATASTLIEAIRQGKFPVGSQLPTEMELMQILDVSRTTLREALRMLEEQGLIVRRRGLGTYVTKRMMVNDISNNFGITQMITQAGLEPGTREFDIRVEEASSTIANALEIEEGSPVVVMERVRTADGVPVVWSFDMLPAEIFGDLVPTPERFKEQSLYEYLLKKHNLWVSHGNANIHPIIAGKEHAEKLKISRHTPLLLFVQTDYDIKNRPLIHAVEYHLADKITFIIHRKGPHY
ncbi:MAG: GntR family transcriptional regulator [Anaerolineaceae bacterium]|nr:GntR family transcriptional regulator [Anaerolineaceae bacterium]